MLRTRANLVSAMMACAGSFVLAGCMAPWAAPSAPGQATAQSPVPTETAHQPTQPGTPGGDSKQETHLAGVLEKLQQVRTIDPAAEQTLIDQLRQTPAESWPLVAEQFRASLAYREQLAAKKKRPRPHGELAEAVVALPDQIAAQADQHLEGPGDAMTNIRARSMDDAGEAPPDYEAPPAKFASEGPTYPSGIRPAPPARIPSVESSPDVQPASFTGDGVRGFTEQDARQLRAAQSSVIETPAAESDWQQLVQEAADDLSGRVAASPTTTAEVHQHVSLRMLRLLAGDTQRALEPIPHVSPLEQDYWSRQFFALASYLDHHSQPDDKRRAAASVTHLDEAVAHLRELGSLALRNLSFCKNVYGYGAIDPYEADRFAPGDEVSLYVEIENYHSQSTEKGFCTLLGSSYELLDEDGQRVGGGAFPDVDDYCRSRRRDFHIQYGLALPESLAPGHYRLQLVVKDRQSDKLGNASIPFEIRGTRP